MTIHEILERLRDLPDFARPPLVSPMDVSGYSISALKELHGAIARALADDDQKAKPDNRTFCVRDTSDWRQWADIYEAELANRQEQFASIIW